MMIEFFNKIKFPLFWRGLGGGLLLLCPAVLSAQNDNGVTVTNLEVGAGTVTFNVRWGDKSLPSVWSDTVWVFVDYNDNGTMRRLELSAGATLTATSAPDVGEVEQLAGNTKGVRVIGNARTNSSFSATVQLLTATANVAGACVYASNYPPLGEWKEDGSGVSFTGTPDYEIVLAHTQSGATSTVTSGKDFIVPSSYTIASFIDKTGAPGTFHCIPPVAPVVAKGEFCYEQSGTLVATAVDDVTVVWYDAPTAGNLLHTGNTLSLAPLYNNTTSYYAQAVSGGNCRSIRIQAEYTVRNCVISGDCPDYTAGNVGSGTTPAACAAHYAGQIGAAGGASSVCVSHDAGRIGGGAVICIPSTAPTSLAASTTTVYAGQTVTLTATGGSNGTGARYEWGTGVAGTGSSVKTTGNTYEVSPATTTTYWVRRVSTVNCGDPTAAVTVTVTTKAYPPDYPVSEVCVGYVIGAIGNEGSGASVAACMMHYAGQIGAAGGASSVCVSHDAGRIGN
jgi:hypothetical protein